MGFQVEGVGREMPGVRDVDLFKGYCVALKASWTGFVGDDRLDERADLSI